MSAVLTIFSQKIKAIDQQSCQDGWMENLVNNGLVKHNIGMWVFYLQKFCFDKNLRDRCDISCRYFPNYRAHSWQNIWRYICNFKTHPAVLALWNILPKAAKDKFMAIPSAV